ncbi:MAG TPA: HEAT repeat domain-containing protein [Polyangiaceae bacterium]|nr:HEAT repeat domain-containing protein [Polyangiaceae bacterium]
MSDPKRPAPDDPLARLRHPSFVPPDRELGPLLDRLARADDDEADALVRALARRGPASAALARGRWAEAEPPLKARLVQLHARVARAKGGDESHNDLVAALDDGAPKVRRAAAFALGKSQTPGLEAPLVARFRVERDEAVRRSLAEALGKIGGEAALEALRGEGGEGNLGAALDRARLTLERTLARAEPSSIDLGRRPPRPLDLVVHCRAGLERWLADELGPELEPTRVAPGTLRARLAGPPARLLDARLMLWFGFPLPPEPLGEGGRVAALARALDAPPARAIFDAFTRGPRRFRLAWADGAHRRADAWALARALAGRPGTPQNDPSESPWEARAHERGPTLYVTLVPLAYDDPRFAYRRRDVPGASHPTIAAALARVGGVRPNDTVWDPFVGSGLELAERGLLGPYRELVGTDLSDEALDAAHENLAGAGLERFALERADARSFRPGVAPSLIVTNPPFGRRVGRGSDLAALYERFLANAARALAPSGRLVWITPRPEPSARAAYELGLEPALRQQIDMGGFPAELQAYVKPEHDPR